MEYDIAQGKTRKLLVEQVNKAIQDGWKPIGGVMYDFEDIATSSKGYESGHEQTRSPRHGLGSTSTSSSTATEEYNIERNAIYFQAIIKE